MKPKTKIQHEVFKMNSNVIDVQKHIETWAFKECNEKLGFATKSKFWCLDCGEYHPISLVKNDKAICPECQIELNITKSRRRKYEQSYWVGFAELSYGAILGEVQVIRLFEVRIYHAVNSKPKTYVNESIRQFVPSDRSKIQYVAKMRNMGQGYPVYGDLELRSAPRYNAWVYNPYPFKYHPWSQFRAQYEKLGINRDLQGLTFLSASQILLYSSKAETLLKLKEYSLLSECSNSRGRIEDHWPSIKIALRNKYSINDAGMWLDYLHLLRFFNKDIRNPKYICPPDLKKEHDRFVKKKNEHDRKIRLKNQREKIAREEKQYREMKSPFFGLAFTKGDLTIKVLESVKEFMEQGDLFRHCVLANEYYKKSDSLILAAFVKDKPIETVEVSLKTMDIVQSRGLHNNPSEYNSDIKELLKSNIPKISNIYGSIKKAN